MCLLKPDITYPATGNYIPPSFIHTPEFTYHSADSSLISTGRQDFTYRSPNYQSRPLNSRSLHREFHRHEFSIAAYNRNNNNAAARDTVPEPSHVMRRSMIIPGWGQIINRQIWKVPVIYGMLAGLAYYAYTMDQYYRDHRAAYFNATNPDEEQKFGPTPDYIGVGVNPESLRYARNHYRNRRDLTFIGVLLAYGLNLVDAYVFAHMRDFDVSDDLSANIRIGPSGNTPHPAGGFTGINSNSLMPHTETLVVTFRLQFP